MPGDPIDRTTRRKFIQYAAAGTVVAGIGLGTALYALAPDEESERARREMRADGRVRLPPGQRLIQRLRKMGGVQGDPDPSAFRLRIHGEVEKPFEIDYAGLRQMPQVEQTCDVHCVTAWSVFDSAWTGVQVAYLAKRAMLKKAARFVIFEAAAGYTANVPLEEALLPNVLVAHHLHGDPIPTPHGSPVRALVPDLYFWKSAKWLTGIRFVGQDEPGYWEIRGYHNHADPWREERHSV